MAPAIRLEIGPEEREIASNQQKVLKGNDKFANLDDEDQKEAMERRLTSILNEYIHAPNVQVRGRIMIYVYVIYINDWFEHFKGHSST